MLFPSASRQIITKCSGCFCVGLRRFVSGQSSVRMPRGALVVFEGCDRSGKTTQCQKLVDALNAEGTKAKMWRFPDRETAIGQVINDYLEQKVELEDHAVHLLFAANRWEAVPKMKALMSEGTTLIVDRYSFSGVAFTAAKPGLELSWCRQPEVGLPNPDAVLYMTVSPEVAASRAAFGGERYERTDFQARVAANYDKLKHSDWKVIDASKTIDDLHVEIKGLVKQIIADSADKDLSQLWTTDDLSEPPAKKACHAPSGAGDCPRLVTTNESNDSGER